MSDTGLNNGPLGDIPAVGVKTKRKPGPAPNLNKEPYIQKRPVMAIRMDPSLKEQIIKVARLSGTNPNQLMQRLLLEGLNP